MMPVLGEAFDHDARVDVVYGDAMAYDLSTLPADSMLISNLPYQISTAILTRALLSGRFSRLVVLVQKEVAQRLAAEPGAKLFGALSVIRSFFGPATLVRDVSAGSFFPPPAVASSVIQIDVTRAGSMPDDLVQLIRSGYAHRRKTLAKNLAMAGWPRAQAAAALEACGLPAAVRAEALNIDTWLELLERMNDPATG
jgi:16S rRNA (adenine1518-N6/adenine1519-N6)-dimethyltransferase